MTTFHFQTHVSDSGVIMLPPDFYNRKVAVVLVEEQGELGKNMEPTSRVMTIGDLIQQQCVNLSKAERLRRR